MTHVSGFLLRSRELIFGDSASPSGPHIPKGPVKPVFVNLTEEQHPMAIQFVSISLFLFFHRPHV